MAVAVSKHIELISSIIQHLESLDSPPSKAIKALKKQFACELESVKDSTFQTDLLEIFFKYKAEQSISSEPSKKRKRLEDSNDKESSSSVNNAKDDDASVEASNSNDNPVQSDNEQSEAKKSANQRQVERFQRIKPEEVEFANEKLKDNRFVKKGGADESSYGYKAHVDLIKTRGKGFTKEKNKKKRGSYRGGQIDMQSHSFKFNSDEE